MKQEFLKNPFVISCDEIENGMLRIATTAKYINGSNIDVFFWCDEYETYADAPKYMLTDLGQTNSEITDMTGGLDRNEDYVRSINFCKAMGIYYHKGEFRLFPKNLDEIQTDVIKLAKFCQVISARGAKSNETGT